MIRGKFIFLAETIKIERKHTSFSKIIGIRYKAYLKLVLYCKEQYLDAFIISKFRKSLFVIFAI